MIMVGLSLGANISYAEEDAPSFELLELLGQFDQQDDNWVDNELKLDTDSEPAVKSDVENKMKKVQKSDSSESINE